MRRFYHMYLYLSRRIFKITVRLRKPLTTPCLPAGRDDGTARPIRNGLSGSVGDAFGKAEEHWKIYLDSCGEESRKIKERLKEEC